MEKCSPIPENCEKENKNGVPSAFPFLILYETLSSDEPNSFPCHWHPEIEFTCVTDGLLEYQANNTIYQINSGDGVFTNSHVLHRGKNLSIQEDCRYISFLIDPVIIYGHRESPVYLKYVKPICTEPELFSRYLDNGSAFGSRLLSLLMDTAGLYSSGHTGHELQIMERLCSIWRIMFQELSPTLNGKETGTATDINRLKTAISFIQSHYTQNITLQDIASSSHISKSECCHLFKHTLRQTPFSYLLSYRIEQSLPLLLDGSRTMTEIAGGLGFHGSSYFSETFKKVMGCSPREYRKTHIK